MPIRKFIPCREGVFYISFSCYNQLDLITQNGAHSEIYDQFDILKSEGHTIVGYVILPNQVHMIIAFRDTGRSINHRIGAIKRFLAYALVDRLYMLGNLKTMHTMMSGVLISEKRKDKLHQVFEPSFIWQRCDHERVIKQKLNSMHHDPCDKKWLLVKKPADYPHSSAFFYETGTQGLYPVTHFKDALI